MSNVTQRSDWDPFWHHLESVLSLYRPSLRRDDEQLSVAMEEYERSLVSDAAARAA